MTIRDHSVPYNQTCGLNMGGGIHHIPRGGYTGPLPPSFNGVDILEISTRTSGLLHPSKHPQIEAWEPAAQYNLAQHIRRT